MCSTITGLRSSGFWVQGPILGGVLLAGEGARTPGTAEVPLSKVPKPQMLTYGPLTSWLLIQAWTLPPPVCSWDTLQYPPHDIAVKKRGEKRSYQRKQVQTFRGWTPTEWLWGLDPLDGQLDIYSWHGTELGGHTVATARPQHSGSHLPKLKPYETHSFGLVVRWYNYITCPSAIDSLVNNLG